MADGTGAGVLVSLVGDGTCTATRVGTGTGEEQGATGLPAGGLGTGRGAQLAVTAGLPDGTGAGATVPIRVGRALGTGAGEVGEAEGTATAGPGAVGPVGLAEAGPGVPVPSAEAALAADDAPDGT